MNSNSAYKEPSSFRDPSGVVFIQGGQIRRQINFCYKKQYEKFMTCGLYEYLVNKHLLIPHKESNELGLYPQSYMVIVPEEVPFISYSYEWSFGQIKDASLVTLKCQRAALEYGMILKDASAYNIQFVNGNALLIDTLSFDMYNDGEPWIAYGQFCRHFLSPLLLMVHTDIRLSQLMRIYIDGIPLDLSSKLLKGKGGFFARQHIHWHAKASLRNSQAGKLKEANSHIKISKFSMLAMIDSLIRNIEKLTIPNIQTEWGDYYSNTNYLDISAKNKADLVSQYLFEVNANSVWDFGSNDGTYSRLALKNGSHVVAFDIDPIAVERNYSVVKNTHEALLPLQLDLTNPSPAIGFANQERGNLQIRRTPDCIMMLAVVHHLAISNNLPFQIIAKWLSSLCRYLIIEFVPKSDSQVQILLNTRDDIFPNYNKQQLEKEFEQYFIIIKQSLIESSERTLYLMKSINKGG